MFSRDSGSGDADCHELGSRVGRLGKLGRACKVCKAYGVAYCCLPQRLWKMSVLLVVTIIMT